MHAKLLFPPKWCYTQPYLSLPSLTAYLRENGIEVLQYDLNIESFHFILEKERLQAKAQHIITSNLLEKLPAKDQEKARDLLQQQEFIINDVVTAFRHLTSLDSLNYRTSKVNTVILEKALALYSWSAHPEKIMLNYYHSAYNECSSEGILNAIEHAEAHLFYDFYAKRVPELVINTDFIGISIIGMDQIIPSMVLAAMIKAHAPEIHICIGGPIFTRWMDRPAIITKFFKYIDSVILYEGEMPLLKLIQTLKNGGDLADVPNLVYCQNGQLQQTGLISPPIFDELPTPDFTGLPLDRYLSPAIVLPLLASRGCYWRKCTFCNHSHIYGGRYDTRSEENLRRDFITITQKYGAKYVNLSDESVSPQILRRISEVLASLDLELYWTCDMRFENSLTRDLMELAYQNGLRVFFFGLESYCDRVRNLMQKGTDKATINRILAKAHQVGIYNHLFFIQGFPTESWAELQETIQFLKECENYVTAGGTQFGLQIGSPVELNPEYYQIELKTLHTDLAFEHPFNSLQGLTREEIRKFSKEFDLKGVLNDNCLEFNNNISRDVWVIFATKLGVEGIFQFAEKSLPPFNSQSTLTLQYGTYYTQAEDGNTLIYDMAHSKKHTMTPDTKIILDLLSERPMTALECTAKITEIFGCPAGSLDKDILPFIEFLYNLELFQVTLEKNLEGEKSS